MRIHVTNETECVRLPTNHTCYRYVQHGMFPNLSGTKDLTSLERSFNRSRHSYTLYQHSDAYLCRRRIPRCDPVTNKVVPPCREMCYDYRKALRRSHYYFNYLPSLNGDVLCFYVPIKCRFPPRVENANIIFNSTHEYFSDYFVHDRVGYSCYWPGSILEGSVFVTWNFNGGWTTPPRCIYKRKAKILPIVLPSLLVLLIVMFLIGACIYRNRRKKRRGFGELTRNKQYDAFVCYCYEGQDPDFAEKIIPQELK